MRVLALSELLGNIGKFVFVTNQETQTTLIDHFAANGLEFLLTGKIVEIVGKQDFWYRYLPTHAL